MSKLRCNVLKISVGANAPNAPPGCAPVIEDSFSAKKKTGTVSVDLIAVYDTVWHRGFTCKLLRLLPDRHMDHGDG